MLSAAHTLAAYVRAHGIGVIACQSSRAHGLGLMVRLLVPRVALVVHRRVDYPPSASFWSRRKYLSARVDRYIAVSDAVTRALEDFGVARSRIATVRDAVDAAPYADIDRTALRAQFGAAWHVPPETPVIGNVAYLTEQKGHETLLRALGVLRANGDPFFCYIAGGGPLEGSLRELAGSLGLDEGCLRFLGIRDDVRDLLGATDVFVLSSNDEGLGTTLLDATYAGCALVATRVGGIPEVVLDEDTGLLAPPRDPAELARQVGRVLHDHQLRLSLSAAARRRVDERFSLDGMVRGTLAVYERAASQ
jgi:glycosyltransferase involved in cell wall biosynthesis